MSQDRGRKLQIVTRRGAAGSVAVVVTAIACGSTTVVEGTGGAGGTGGTGGAPTTSTGGSGDGGFGFPGGGFGAGGEPFCEPGTTEETYMVTVPPEGVPATVGEICSITVGPVESNQAARVTLTKDPQALELASGEVTVAPDLLSDVVGIPTIEVVDSPYYAELFQMSVANVTPTPSGFTFDASWPPLPPIEGDGTAMIVVRTTFDLACPPNQTKQVQALTHLNLCLDESAEPTWVSSGDECTICGIIAEMAPSPIVPDRSVDDIGLGDVLQLRLVIVARIGRSLLFLAEHSGGEGLDYDWVVSGGEVQQVANDLLLWTPPEDATEPPLLQVAVHGDDAAAVASYVDVLVREAGLVA